MKAPGEYSYFPGFLTSHAEKSEAVSTVQKFERASKSKSAQVVIFSSRKLSQTFSMPLLAKRVLDFKSSYHYLSKALAMLNAVAHIAYSL